MRIAADIEDILRKSRMGNTIADTPRIILSAAASAVLNGSYAIFNGVIAIIDRSIWFMSLSAFYLILTLMKLMAIAKTARITDADNRRIRAVYAFSGTMLILMDAALSVITLITLRDGHSTKHSTIVMITIALYVFSKITMIVIRDLRGKYREYPAISAIKAINWSETAVSVFTMQQSMLATFSSGNDEMKALIMNIATSTAVSIFIAALGITLIVKGARDGKVKNRRSK